jgi:hypothetical protein
VGGPYTIPINISRGTVGYLPTTTIIKLCQFTGPHKASMHSVQFKYLLEVPLRTVLNRHRRGGYHLGASNIHNPLPTFPYEDTLLSPSCPARSQIKPSLQILQHNHYNTTSVGKRGGRTCEWDLPFIFYRYLVLSIAHLTATYSYKGNKDNMEGYT